MIRQYRYGHLIIPFLQGELITEASNYNPLDAPCKSLTPEALGLSKQITEDLLIVISAPRYGSIHM